MSTDENIPYKLSFGDGIQPSELAWYEVTFVSNEAYNAEFNTSMPEIPEGAPVPSGISLQDTGLLERDAALVVREKAEALMPFMQLIDGLRDRLDELGASEEQADHMVNIFSIGLLVGVKTVEITTVYAEQGIRDIEQSQSG